jgi:hypothetical protein
VSETVQRLRIACQLFREELQSNGSAEIQVLSLVHHAHAATTKLLDDAVMRDGLTDHWREILRF